ncbi:hypothetical protein OM076_36085 [Solirubrobacter ginsenosidimutans]|uniref:IrrE N-terminal-like domain-containing protein n=1 Tax=Solirubrobacter ginsenosidimutans TaxID=490573 RepID=A0A9X3N6G0_9ACTN|nr:hypothetical protein [Solirubrobacter ginsenosidimutans]MDA0165743.1 hypothetical protein [Solirubrobacter ginsenosidimutans]
MIGLLVLEDDTPAPRPAAKTASVATIASRVEVLRGLRFRSRPVPQSVSPAQARREGLEDLDRSYPEARRRADEEVLKLLGLIEPRVDLRAISASVFGEGVAGYYDPRSKRLRIVSGTTPDALSEMVLAHELTHALEDQRFGLALSEGESDDAALARLALVEGTATLVMQQYLLRYIGAEKALSGALASALETGPDLPKFLQDQLLWPYVGGMQFAQALRQQGAGTWKLVDLADRVRVPDSTEQVMHPEKWVAVETPLPVRLAVPLHDDWRRTLSGTWGEWQTNELLGGNAEAAAAGWGGDRYELWQKGAASCGSPPPCRAADVLVMRWRWDTPRDAREFETALRAAPVARVDGATVEAHGDTVTLVLAPTPALARRVAASA